MDLTGTLTTPEVCKVTGVTARCLDYWVRKEWVHALAVNPVGRIVERDGKNPGSGNRRRYVRIEVEIVDAIVELIGIGFTVEAAAPIARRWIESGEPTVDLGSGLRLTSQRLLREYHERVQSLRETRDELEAS